MSTRDQWYKPNLLYNIHWQPPKKPEPPKMVVETVRFNPSICTCGEHDCEPRYRMERRVVWKNNEMPSFKQRAGEIGEMMKSGDGFEKKSLENDSKVNDLVDDNEKDVSQDGKGDYGVWKTEENKENSYNGSDNGNDVSLKTENDRENGDNRCDRKRRDYQECGDDSRCCSKGDYTGKNDCRERDRENRSCINGDDPKKKASRERGDDNIYGGNGDAMNRNIYMESDGYSLCGDNGDDMKKNVYRESDEDNRPTDGRYVDSLNTDEVMVGSKFDSGGGSDDGVKTKRDRESSEDNKNVEGHRHDSSNENKSGNNNEMEINGNRKSITDSLHNEDGVDDNNLQTGGNRACSNDDTAFCRQNDGAAISEDEENADEYGVCGICEDTANDLNGYHDGKSKIVYDGGKDYQESFGDEISPAFGILSIYCNSEIHCMVDSSFGH